MSIKILLPLMSVREKFIIREIFSRAYCEKWNRNKSIAQVLVSPSKMSKVYCHLFHFVLNKVKYNHKVILYLDPFVMYGTKKWNMQWYSISREISNFLMQSTTRGIYQCCWLDLCVHIKEWMSFDIIIQTSDGLVKELTCNVKEVNKKKSHRAYVNDEWYV